MTYLQNAHADAGPVAVAGVDDLSTGRPDVAAALAGIAPGQPVLLLMHEPDGFAAVPRSVALTLAGHTHGGQVRLPLVGALLTNTRLGYVRGRYVVGGRTLIVSSGVGTSVLPIRLGVRPEIVVVTLHAP
jgi:predicted MPP superfamily phosphohydrolase